MKKCAQCSKDNLQNAKFCMACGTTFAEAAPTFESTPIAQAFIKVISNEFLTSWSEDGVTLTLASKENPEAVASVVQSKRSPSAISITTCVGVFHQNLDKQWDFKGAVFNPAEMSVLNDLYVQYFKSDRSKADKFSENSLSEEHRHYIGVANEMILGGSSANLYDGTNPEAIPHSVSLMKSIVDEKPKKVRYQFQGLEGIQSWQLQRSLVTVTAPTVFAGVPGTSNKSKSFPKLGYIGLADGWQPMLLVYEYNFSPVQESTLAVVRSAFEIRDTWMPTFAMITNSCGGHMVPFSELPSAEPLG